MRIIILILLLLLFDSCQLFDTPSLSKEELIQKELNAVNWKEVDEFPSILECDKIKDEPTRRQCFFEILTQTIQEKLNSDTLALLYPSMDTIDVKVTIFPNATIKFEPQFPEDSLAYDKTKIEQILNSKLVDFPKINPATKRGIPVTTQFMLPVILKADN